MFSQVIPSIRDGRKLEEEEKESEPLFEKTETSQIYNETVELQIDTIKCSGCSLKLEKLLLKSKGIVKVSINVLTKNAFVTYDKRETTIEEILEVIKNAKHKVFIFNRSLNDYGSFYFKYYDESFNVEWMKKITGCDFIYFKTVEPFHFFKVEYSKRVIGVRKLHQFLSKNLKEFEIIERSEIFPAFFESEVKYWFRMFMISLIFGACTMTLMIFEMVRPQIHRLLVVPGLSVLNLIMFIFCTIVQIVVGTPLYVSAYSSIKLGVNMDFLISVATSISYIYSCAIMVVAIAKKSTENHHTFFDTPPMLYMIVSLGRYIESRGKRLTINSIKTMIKPIKQTLEIEYYNLEKKVNERQKVDSMLIEENDIVTIFQGMRLPSDGKIYEVEEFAMINEAILTGESLPVSKMVNEDVYCGTINEGMPFKMKVTSVGDDCRIQKIAKSVQNANVNKIKFNNIVNVVSRNFVPYIILLSLLTFSLWISAFMIFPDLQEKLKISSYVEFSFKSAISVLCVACPCAIGLAIPLAIMIATGVGAKYGIFIKGGPPLQLLSKIKRYIFDKTGTLTQGTPVVTNFKVYAKENPKYDVELYKKAIHFLTTYSNHLLSKCIRNYLEKDLNSNSKIIMHEFKEISGFGLKGTIIIDEIQIKVIIGKQELIESNDGVIENEINKEILSLSVKGVTVVFVLIENNLIGVFYIRDVLRTDASYTIHHLKNMCIWPIMLTGDRKECAKYVAEEVGISELYFNMTPEEKSEIVKFAGKDNQEVAMVGDGINDIIAMANSSVGIAIGTSMDITTETANVVIMNNKLHSILNLIVLSKMTMRTIYRNLIFSFAYNLIAVPMAAGCFKWVGFDIQPWVASIAMVCSSLSVTFSSMLILLFKPPFDGINEPDFD